MHLEPWFQTDPHCYFVAIGSDDHNLILFAVLLLILFVVVVVVVVVVCIVIGVHLATEGLEIKHSN